MVRVFADSVLGVLVALLLVRADAQPGFISIDCGRPQNYNQTDAKGINYISDAEFIDTGEIRAISPEFKNTTLDEEFWNLRSFPEGVRNCYSIKPPEGKDQRYLIRARFLYGNYDNKNQTPKFDLFLGVDRWGSVNLQNSFDAVTKELIHVPLLDYIQICLINTESGVPFISALELRLLENSTYVAASGSLQLFQRLDFGLETNPIVRYPDDIYDRIWSPSNFADTESIGLSNASPVEPNIFNVSSNVLATAVRPINDSQALQFLWRTDNLTYQVYLYMHFAEVENLIADDYRAFNISINERSWFGPLHPSNFSATTVFSIRGILTIGGRLLVSINRFENSTLPPLINAIEIFVEKHLPQLQTNQIEIDALLNIKSTYSVKKNWQGDPCYPQEYLWVGLNCSYNGETQPNITSLNLSSSRLAGEISFAISNLTMIQYLDLSNNRLNGTVPAFLAKLPHLRVLNLENNNLSGTIPVELMQGSKNGSFSLSAGGNPYLRLSEPSSKKDEAKYVIPLATSLGGAIILLLIGGAVFWYLRRQKKKGKLITGRDKKGGMLGVTEKKQITYSQILSITNNFERVLGKGGFGTVYYGNLDGIQVSVKMLSPESIQGYTQFQTEAQLLTRIQHGNLTSVLGYCDEDTHLGLVYEYMENGNLADHLSGKSNRILAWKERLGIALDAAQGLEYLHFGCKPPIIHRDIKSTNILLDVNFHAKLADFGMSKVFQLQDGAQASAVVGTPGYLDPEYTMAKKLSEKSDVYSFGVVLLEIITGRQAVTKSRDKTHVIEWVNLMLKEGEIKDIIDPKLGLDIKNSSIQKVLDLAIACVSSSSSGRPIMTQAVMELKQCLAVFENSRENNHERSSSFELVAVALNRDFQER